MGQIDTTYCPGDTMKGTHHHFCGALAKRGIPESNQEETLDKSNRKAFFKITALRLSIVNASKVKESQGMALLQGG
jgi:hypothetical protein